MAVSFKGAHVPPELSLMGFRWYLAYPLSTRHVAELLEERRVKMDHATINRWVIQYSPQLKDEFHRRKRPVWGQLTDRRDRSQGQKPVGIALLRGGSIRQDHRLTLTAPRLKSARLTISITSSSRLIEG